MEDNKDNNQMDSFNEEKDKGFICDNCGQFLSNKEKRCPNCNQSVGIVEVFCPNCKYSYFKRIGTLSTRKGAYTYFDKSLNCPIGCENEPDASFTPFP